MKQLFLIIAIAVTTINVPGQTPWARKRDSLLKVLSGMKEDSNKVWTMLWLGVGYIDNQPDSTVYYAAAMTKLSEKLYLPAGIADALSLRAVVLRNQNRLDEAIGLDLEAIEIAKKAHLQKILANLYNNTAIIYNTKGDHTASLDFYLKAGTIYEQLRDSSFMALVYCNIASVYNDLRENKSGYAYALKGISLCRYLHQTNGFGAGMVNLSTSLLNLQRFDTALVVLREALDFVKGANDKNQEVSVLANINFAYVGLKKFRLIKAIAKELMSVARSIDSKVGMCYASLGLMEYYRNEKDYAKAGRYARNAIEIAENNQLITHLRDAYRGAGRVEMERGNIAGYDHYDNLRDSIDGLLQSDKIVKNTQELEAKYSLNKKQTEIDDLNKQKQIQQLTLRQRSTMNWVLTGLVLVIALIGLLYSRNYRQKKKLLLADTMLQQQRITELERETQLLAAQAVVQGQVEERARLAKDLHDGLGSILSSAKYSFTNMKENLIITPENAEAFERSMGMLDKSITELRRVAHNMMPEALMKFGLDTALKDFCNSVEQSGAVQLTYQSFEIQETSIPAITSSAVYRIIQELVNNILKHADATTALVQLVRKDNTLSITVEDNGKGFDPGILQNVTGIGYLNLRNRVAYLNGTLDIQTAPGKGTSVNIEITNIAG